MNATKSNKAPIFGISRHRIGIDGEGITTLVTFMGCPLKCKYCINDIYHTATDQPNVEWLSPQELYDRVKIDNLYFLATSGGITFGGGEPALYVDFIKEFKSICPKEWNLNLETSLNYPCKHIEKLLPIIDEFIIDIKDMDVEVYKAYTDRDNAQVIQNLIIIKEKGRDEDCLIRVPSITNFTKNQEKSINKLHELGFNRLETFNYVIK